MAQRNVFAGAVLFEVDPKRYDDLITKENELYLLKEAVAKLPDEYNTELKTVKKIFNIEKEATENEKDI